MFYVFTALVFKFNLSSILLLFLPFINVGVIKPISSLEVNTQSQLEIPQYVLQSEICDTQSQS